jgi:NADH-quinone oxidoreductase subunit J
MDNLLFYLFAAVAVSAAIGVIAFRRVFYAALSLIVCLSALAGIYMLLEAPFIAAVQIIVYAGAIMVMFLFIIMLLDPFSAAAYQDRKRYLKFLAWILGGTALILLYPLLKSYDPSRAPGDITVPAGGFGLVAGLAQKLFTEYLLPFEVTSVLILIAIIGAVVLARRQNQGEL